LFVCALHSRVVVEDVLSRGVKELLIGRGAELVAAGAVDDAHGPPRGQFMVGKQVVSRLRRLTAIGFRLFY